MKSTTKKETKQNILQIYKAYCRYKYTACSVSMDMIHIADRFWTSQYPVRTVEYFASGWAATRGNKALLVSTTCLLSHTHTHPQTHKRAEGNARQCGLDSVESLEGEEKQSEVPHLDSALSHAGWCTLPAAFLVPPPPPYSRNQEDSDNEQRWLFCNLFSVFAEHRASAQSRGTFTEGKEKHRGKSKISEVATYGSRYKRRVSSHNLCKKKKSCIRIYSCGRKRNRGWEGRGIIIKKKELLGLF